MQRIFWEEYVREKSQGGPGGLDSGAGPFPFLYLILPLLAGLLLIGMAMVAVWRCHSHKLFQRSPAYGPGSRDPSPAFVSMDRHGRTYRAEPGSSPELSAQSSPSHPGPELPPGRAPRGDPPPSYEEAIGRTEPPPQYEEIIHTGGSRVVIGHGK